MLRRHSFQRLWMREVWCSRTRMAPTHPAATFTKCFTISKATGSYVWRMERVAKVRNRQHVIDAQSLCWDELLRLVVLLDWLHHWHRTEYQDYEEKNHKKKDKGMCFDGMFWFRPPKLHPKLHLKFNLEPENGPGKGDSFWKPSFHVPWGVNYTGAVYSAAPIIVHIGAWTLPGSPNG